MRLPPGCHEARTGIDPLLAGDGTDAAALRLGLPIPESLAHAVDKRRREFLAGRWCAREALRAAGLADPPQVAIGAEREPLWPRGYVGSISHSRGEAWAVAAPAARLRAIGIDLEREQDDARWERLLPRLLAEGESLPVPGGAWPEPLRAALLFAAKEAFYKCVAPLGGEALGFADARIAGCQADAGDGATGTLAVELLRTATPGLPRGMQVGGRYELHDTGARCCLWIEAG